MLLFIATLLPQVGWAQTTSQPQKGDGSKDNPYEISSAAELAWFRDYVNAGNTSVSAVLTNDIDLKDFCHAASSDGKLQEVSWLPVGKSRNCTFQGTFDGKGFTIKNLYVKGTYFSSFLGCVENSTVKNLTFENAYVDSTPYGISAILSAQLTSSTIQNIKTLPSCSVKGTTYVGGIIGSTSASGESTLNNCFNYATVEGDGYCVGGLIGNSGSPISIISCINYATVTNSSKYVGGLIGEAKKGGIIQNSANLGNIKASSCAGNFVGQAKNVILKNVFCSGNISCTSDAAKILFQATTGDKNSVEGVIAYSSDITLIENGNVLEGENKKLSDGTITVPDGKTINDIVKGFTLEHFKSGEATYLLNNSSSVSSAISWYQKIGTDTYPLLTSKGGDIVYHGTECNKTTDVYTNDNSIFGEDGAIPHNMVEAAETNGLYCETCTKCHAAKEEGIHYIKDFCGISGNNLKLSLQSDNTYKAVDSKVTITDKDAYNSPVDFTADEVDYTREYLGENMWQAAYVPFDIDATEWTNNGITAASINNFHEYELEDGSYETVLEVKKATSGSLTANTPYIISCADNGEKTITIHNAQLRKAASQTIDCQSVTRKYEFTGIYTPQSGFNADASSPLVYALSKQGTMAPLSNSATLGAQRWYLTITNRNTSSTPQASMARDIRIKVIGEGTATGINDLRVLTSKGTNAPQSGIYDMQGRRLNAEPAHGIYIKNGKKYVK